MNKKDMIEYRDKYGDIPKDFTERFSALMESSKLSDKDKEKLSIGSRKLLQSKWTELKFVIYFIPKSTPRPRSGRFGVFYVKGAKDNNDLFKEFIEHSSETFGYITTATTLNVDAYLPTPTQMNRIEKILSELKLVRPLVKPDWDNIGKTYSDMIQKHLLIEDCLIIDGRTRKYYSMKPRVEITLRFMNKYDSRFNKKKVEAWKFYKEIEDKAITRDYIV